MLFLLVQFRGLGQFIQGAVDPHPGETIGLQLLQLLAILPLAPAHDRCQHQQPGLLRQGQHPIDHLLDGLGGDRLVALRAVHLPGAGKQHPQVVVNLGDGTDRGTGILRSGLLLDGNRRGEPFDTLDIRLVHLLQELAGIGGEALHVAALPLGVNGVEGEGRFPRTGHAGDDHQPVARDLDVDAFEVVLAGTLDDDLVGH